MTLNIRSAHLYFLSAGMIDVYHHPQYIWYWESDQVFILGKLSNNAATFPALLFFLNTVFQCCSFLFAHGVGTDTLPLSLPYLH